MLPSEIRHTLGEVSDHWWLFLIGGVAWFVISLVVLRLDIASVAATVGVFMGVVFLLSGFKEVFIASVRSGWRWARVLMAVVFFAGSIWSFITPFGAFWSLASVSGFSCSSRGLSTSSSPLPLSRSTPSGELPGLRRPASSKSAWGSGPRSSCSQLELCCYCSGSASMRCPRLLRDRTGVPAAPEKVEDFDANRRAESEGE